jgi:hypothetical protein
LCGRRKGRAFSFPSFPRNVPVNREISFRANELSNEIARTSAFPNKIWEREKDGRPGQFACPGDPQQRVTGSYFPAFLLNTFLTEGELLPVRVGVALAHPESEVSGPPDEVLD